MLQQVIFVRHGECEKRVDTIASVADRPLLQRDWPLSTFGEAQMRIAGEYLASKNIKFDELQSGSSRRNRYSAHYLNIATPKWQIDDCLDSRLRTVGENASSDPYYGRGSSPLDESYKDFLRDTTAVIFDKLDRHWDRKRSFLFVTCREFILGIQFRMQKLGITDRVAALVQKGTEGTPGILDCREGELIEFSSVDPESCRQHKWFRWKRRISPMDSSRSTSWERFRSTTFTNAELIDESLWNPPASLVRKSDAPQLPDAQTHH